MDTSCEFKNPASLVAASWLSKRLEDPAVVVVDTRYTVEIDDEGRFRSVPGGDGYLEAHIPGAVFVNLNDLKHPTDPTRIMDPDDFAQAMSRIGISGDSEVVVYDTEGGTWAARLWWALRYYGHETVSILNGGFHAWTRVPLPTESGDVTKHPSRFVSSVRPDLRVGMDDVLASIESDGTVIVDALPEPFYTGQVPLYSHLRRGHIPGAVNIAAPALVDPATWELLPPDQLLEMWGSVTNADRIITYCGGGVYGAFDMFVLHILGFDSALYDGSWEEWGARDDTPIETGPDTTRSR